MKMKCKPVEQFVALLKQSPTGPVFNPWWQIDFENDIGSTAPRIRREQLRVYLCARLRTARLAVIGEALGYRGGHFTGIAMTSERILMGRSKPIIVSSDLVLPGLGPRRTSNPAKRAFGFSESTATIVWSALLAAGFHPLEFVLWNAFPWHSFDLRSGMLSNRMPTKSEQAAGLPVLSAFLGIFRFQQVIVLGKIAASQLEKMKIRATCIRHPASGGARIFRRQIASLQPVPGQKTLAEAT